MKPFQTDQILFTFSDMKRLYLRHSRNIKKIAWITSVVIFLFLLLSAPKYKTEATFKQSSRQKDVSMQMKEMFQQFMDLPVESGTIAVMQSHEVIKGVVEKLGLQASCRSDFFLVSLFQRIWNNLRSEFGGSISDPDGFVFSDVSYSGERPLNMFLVPTAHSSYQIYDLNKTLIAQGKLGEEISFNNGKLRLKSVKKNIALNKFYSLTLQPMVKTVDSLRKSLKIHPHKLDKAILQLAFTSRNRLVGAQFLNELMQSYQNFLKRENDDVCKNQLQYLHQRQEELTTYYDKALSEHSAYLNENLSHNGFIGFAQEIETLSAPKNFYTSKLFNVDLELKRLCDSKDFNKQQMALEQNKKKAVPLLPQQRKEAQDQLENCEYEFLSLETTLKAEKTPQSQKMEQAALLLQGEFSGLSPDIAQGLLVEYTRQRDALQAQVRELVFLTEQLGRPDFEMSSLGGIIDDPVTKDIGNKASVIALQLKDENNRSIREQERLIEALQTQKSFLSHYLQQTIELKMLRVKLLKDKIHSLQMATLSLLQTEKDLLKNKLQDLNRKMGDLPEKWRRESLLMLKKEMGAVMLEGVSQLVETKSLGQHTFQISSRPLDRAIPALKPKSPGILIVVFLSALLSATVYYFFIFAKALFKGLPASDAILKLAGFPVSGKVTPFCNALLSQVGQGDLETLRHLVEFLGSGNSTALCIKGKYADITSPLAELLSMRGKKVIVVQCGSQVLHADQVPGLWQYLQGQVDEIPLRRHLNYDYLPAGGTSVHFPEILCSSKFETLLSKLQGDYDVVLVCSHADPAKIEAFSLLKLADTAIVTHQMESKEDLQVYNTWAEQKEGRRVTFVFAQEVF